MSRWIVIVCVLAVVLVACYAINRTLSGDAADKAEVVAKKQENEEFSHERWDKLLKEHVTAEGWVDYAGMKEDTAELNAYLGELAGADVSKLKSREEQMAFWINAYNAICVRKLIDHGLPESVPHAVVFGKNIFKEVTYEVAGKERSLDNIEHDILRPQFGDNRVHAVVVCGASSCPRLRPQAYVGGQLNAWLDEECRSWVNVEKNKKGERKNRLDREGNTFYASKIFYWYKEDFGGSDEGVMAFIKKFLDDADRQYCESNPVKLEFLDYDWSLNSQ